jgi:Protein of unknown function (DUF1566)
MKLKTMVFAALAALCMTSGAEAALVSRLGGKAYYDTVNNLTWLQNADYARTSGYDADGLMKWADAVAWAGSLNIEGVTGWRLPSLSYTAPYSDELRTLYIDVMGGVSKNQIFLLHNANYDLFANVTGNVFWYGTTRAGSPSEAYQFTYEVKGQAQPKINYAKAWAVHSGDVGASPVPLPGTLVLMAPALLGLFRRRTA